MKKVRLAFVAVAVIAALSAFTTNYFAIHHYVLHNGLFELIDDYDPVWCAPRPGAQCSYLLESTGTPPQTVYPDDDLYNKILGSPDPNGVDKELVF